MAPRGGLSERRSGVPVSEGTRCGDGGSSRRRAEARIRASFRWRMALKLSGLDMRGTCPWMKGMWAQVRSLARIREIPSRRE